MLAHLRDANTLVGMKSLALTNPRPRIYTDLRAASTLGGYYFNLTRCLLRIPVPLPPRPAAVSSCHHAHRQRLNKLTPPSLAPPWCARLEHHLELSDEILPENYTCSAEGEPVAGRPAASLVASSPGSHYFMQRVGSSQ